jgi:hypothetical protein
MRTHLPRTLLPALAALLCALALGACGGKRQPYTVGENEGALIKVGPLTYQVQLSRELNPQNVEDRQYLAGLASGTAQPKGDEEWFGVWIRVENPTKQAHQTAREFKIVDTTGAEYRPIPLPATNTLSYQPSNVQGQDGQPVFPDPQSVAGSGPIGGAMLLFKLRTDVYANRPLELEITPPNGGTPSRVQLDL